MHFVGVQAACPAWIAQVAGQLHIGRQAARHAPARWGKAGPNTQVWHLRLDGACQRRILGHGGGQVVFAFVLQRGLQVGGELACVGRIPVDLGAYLLVLHGDLDLRGANAGGDGFALCGKGFGDTAFAAAGVEGHALGHIALGVQAHVAAGALHHQLGVQAVAGVDVPIALHDQVRVERVVRLVGGGLLKGARPAQRQAGDAARALQQHRFIAALRELQRPPLHIGGARLGAGNLQLAGAGAGLQGLVALRQLHFKVQRLLQIDVPRRLLRGQAGAGLQVADGTTPSVGAAAVGGQLQLAGKLLLAMAGVGLHIGLQFGDAAAGAEFGVAQLPLVGRIGAGAHGELWGGDVGIQRKRLRALGADAFGHLGQQACAVQLAQGIGIAAVKAQLGIQAALGADVRRQRPGHAGYFAQPLQQLLGAGELQVDLALALGGRCLGFGAQRGARHLHGQLASATLLLGIGDELLGLYARAQGVDLRGLQLQLGRLPLPFGDDVVNGE